MIKGRSLGILRIYSVKSWLVSMLLTMMTSLSINGNLKSFTRSNLFLVQEVSTLIEKNRVPGKFCFIILTSYQVSHDTLYTNGEIYLNDSTIM